MKPNLPLIFLYRLMPTSWASLLLLADIVLEQPQKSQDKKFDSTTVPSTKSTPSTANQNATTPFHSRSTSLSPTDLSSPSQDTENSQAQPAKQQGSTSWTECSRRGASTAPTGSLTAAACSSKLSRTDCLPRNCQYSHLFYSVL